MVLMFNRMRTNFERHRPHYEEERDAKREREGFDESVHCDDQQDKGQLHEKFNQLGKKSYENLQYPVKLRSVRGRGLFRSMGLDFLIFLSFLS